MLLCLSPKENRETPPPPPGGGCDLHVLTAIQDVASKSGYLSKRGRSIVKFTRYWFILKGDVLSYFSDSSDPYFPTGHIDLRYGISASLVDARDGKDPCDFTVTTNQRKYYFHADSAPSAKEWVKSLLKAIFRTQNESDSVKISIPVANVMAVEESPVLDFADTIKLNVIDNDDTYAIDEVSIAYSPPPQNTEKKEKKITKFSNGHFPSLRTSPVLLLVLQCWQ